MLHKESKKGGKDQELIQLSATPDPEAVYQGMHCLLKEKTILRDRNALSYRNFDVQHILKCKFDSSIV